MSTKSLFDQVTAQLPDLPASKPVKPLGMPEAAKRSLEKRGLRDRDTGAMRTARKGRCSECRRAVWLGIDRQYGGLARECDPRPLTAAGEVAALLDGVRTFDLQWRGDRYELDSRNAGHIQYFPAGISGMDVLAEHRHEKHNYETGKSQLRDKATPAVVYGDKPPY